MKKCDLCNKKALVVENDRDYLCAQCWLKHQPKQPKRNKK